MFNNTHKKKIDEMSEKLSAMLNELKFQQSRSLAVFSGMKEGVIVTDTYGKLISANTAIEKFFGVNFCDIEGRSVIEALRNSEIAFLIEKAGKENAEFEEEIDIYVPGRAVFSAYSGPIKDKGGEVLGVICVLHDITRVKELERFRSEFMANITHELKTPLTAIRSFAETLLSGAMADKENSSKFLSKINEHSINLSVLIDDILELSRLEAGSKDVESKKTDISVIAQKAADDLEYKAKAKNIVIRTKLEKCTVDGYEDHIYRAILNIVDNAINYTDRGGEISIKCEKKDDTVKVSVKDSGIGIPDESIPRVFERFYRVDRDRSRQSGGTGLGLSIVKHVMELHKGKVLVTSEEGKGSTFTLLFHL